MSSIKNLIVTDGSERIMWNSELGQLEVGEGDTGRTLLLASRPYFSVKNIHMSPIKNLLALSGDNGITIVEIPRKWTGKFKCDANKQVYCKTHNLNERLFTCEKRLKILHVAWHPHVSETKQTMCILTNDNRLSLHDAINDKELQVINLKIQNKQDFDDEDHICSAISLLNLGEAAICFDFGPPKVVQKHEVLWPIYVLMGSGEILLVYTNIHNPTYSEHIIGPLIMLPQAEDNYGSDACDILVSESSPPMIAIATPTGQIYHCFAFDDKPALLSPQTLHVYECIEIAKDLIENPDDPYSLHQIKLFKDPTSQIRYFCVHQNGIHTVVLPVLESIQTQCDILEDIESFSEYLICTRTSTPADNLENSTIIDQSTPRGIGVEIRESKIVLTVLLPNNQLITERISPATTLINRRRFPRHSLDTSSNSNDVEVLDVSQVDAARSNFVDQLDQILKRKASVPVLKLSESLESNEKISELLNGTVATFKIEYIKKFKIAAEAIKKKLNILVNDLNNQRNEYHNMEKLKGDLNTRVCTLVSKAKKASEMQDNLQTRIDKLLTAVAYGHSEPTDAELKLKRELTTLQEKISTYRDQFETVVAKHKYQTSIVTEPQRYTTKDVVLTPNQLEMIKDTLCRQGAEIAELKRVIKAKLPETNSNSTLAITSS